MAYFEWKEEYSVEVPSIDAQHKKLVAMLNELYDAMSTGSASGAVIKKTIDSLLAYTRTHFLYEEQLMEKHGYPEFEDHKQRHAVMTKRVMDFASKMDQGPSKPVLEFAAFLKDWLQKHIQGTDKRYGPFLKDKGVM